MAQALFDGHPIEQYLRESGDLPELLPGGIHEFTEFRGVPLEDIRHYLPNSVSIWLKRPFQYLLECVIPRTKPAAIFAERFKYLVISSSLLSSSLSFLPSLNISRAVTPTTPGHYDPSPASPSTTKSTVAAFPLVLIPSYMLACLLGCLVPVALAMGSYLSGIFLATAVWILTGIDAEKVDQGPEMWKMTLEALEALISVNEAWDSTVSEAFRVLESDEQFPARRTEFSSSSMMHPLWSSLSSSLHTIQTQCDDVRQLLEVLTSPHVLSQLSHMYAPALPSRLSPKPTTISLSPSPRRRPISLTVPSQSSRLPSSSSSSPPSDVHTRSRTLSSHAPSQSVVDKRATWNGLPLRSKRRSDNLSSLFDNDNDKPRSSMALASSAPPTPTIRKEIFREEQEEGEPSFGASALDLRRKRRSRFGAAILDTTLTSTIGSRYTSLTPPSSSTNPNTPQSLHNALQGAISARRFACAHLLALRFDDDDTTTTTESHRRHHFEGEDETYWENVRSIITLLTSALEDASARLDHALQRIRREREEREQMEERPLPKDNSTTPSSFAPVPSHLTRFLGHIDAMSAALDDARVHLYECLAATLREGDCSEQQQDEDHEMQQAYDRLRSELGLALREWERGKEPLRCVIAERRCTTIEDGAETSGVHHHDEQSSSSGSDKTLSNVEEEEDQKLDKTLSNVEEEEEDDKIDYNDDATAHLLSITSVHPPSGIEQVFEADTTAMPLTRRPRSTLSREERIALSRARRRRENGEQDDNSCEKKKAYAGWGPGGEVVEELKDVIWKVNEQRRQMVISRDCSMP